MAAARLRPLGVLSLALALTASCTSGRGGGTAASGGAGDRETMSTTAGADDGLHGATGPAPTAEDAPVAIVDGTPVHPGPTVKSGRGAGSGAGTTTSGGPTTTTGAAGPTTTLPPGLPPEKCPEPKTCRRYAFGAGNDAANAPRWPIGPDGRATVSYWVNPTSSGLPDDHVKGAIAAAFATWERAAPTLRFDFRGFTDKQAVSGDGLNVVAFNNPANTGLALPRVKDGAMVEADMLLGASGNWTWTPCEQRDGSCTPAYVPTATGTGYRFELQSVVTHEAGHWLWLGDMGDDDTDRYLTMYPGSTDQLTNTSRFWSTLALGDVLGVRALYPCSCPLPPIYDP